MIEIVNPFRAMHGFQLFVVPLHHDSETYNSRCGHGMFVVLGTRREDP